MDESDIKCASYDVCANAGIKCSICFDQVHFTPKKTKRQTKLQRHSNLSDRQGSAFERRNHEQNQKILTDTAVSSMTPNSGAGYIKGDEQISGIVSVMEELKTKITKQTRGKETFTIHKTWLDKLTREAVSENKEFWYLKFAFHESESDWYCVVSNEVIMSFIKTIVTDRTTAKNADRLIELANRQKETAIAENTYLRARIRELETENAILKDAKTRDA